MMSQQSTEPYVPVAVQDSAVMMLTFCAPDYLAGDRRERVLNIVWREMSQERIDKFAKATGGYILEGIVEHFDPDTVEINPLFRKDVDTVAHEMIHVAVGKAGHGYMAFAKCHLETALP